MSYSYPAPTGPGGTPPTGPVPLELPLYGAGIGEAFQRFWKKYATFSGRASRSEYWWWFLIAIIVNSLFSSLSQLDGAAGTAFGALSGLWGLAIIIPTLALLWRRLHDTNRSGLWALVPAVLWILSLTTILVGVIGVLVARNNGSVGDGAFLALGGLAAVAVIVLAIASITLFVFTLLPSNPAGARFDRPGPLAR